MCRRWGVIPRCCGFHLWHLSALTRRGVICYRMRVNCGPAKCCVWPDIDRHRRGCARGLFCAAVVVLLRRLRPFRACRAFLRKRISLTMFPAGSPLGAEMWKPHCGRPQTCAKESNLEAALRPLWTLFIVGRGVSTSLPNATITAISELPCSRPATLGYTERPARVQFMLGQVGLYIDVIYAHQRLESKRPQALKSRVACAERCGSRTAVSAGCKSNPAAPCR